MLKQWTIPEITKSALESGLKLLILFILKQIYRIYTREASHLASTST